MKFALLIYEDEAAYASEAALQAVIAQHRAFAQSLGSILIGGSGLKEAATATTVRLAGGRRTLHDGPFAESKEQLGGFYLIDTPDLDAALEIARRLPLSEGGSVEVRPMLEGE
jgi:hypothetical protein